MIADFTFTVRLIGADTLTGQGFERFADAVGAADLPGAIHDAVVEALRRTLPTDGQGDEHHEPPPPMDWYTLRISAA
jgi:hypothetical protein